jgi:hypothetical protein
LLWYGTFRQRREQDEAQLEHDHPEQQVEKQQARGRPSSATPQQSRTACERDRGAEPDQHFARRNRLGNRLPDLDEVAQNPTEHADADHGQREHHPPHIQDSHRSALRTRRAERSRMFRCEQ